MLCRDIINIIEDTYPKTAALEWDNVGLLVGRTDKEVKKIYVALDATDDVIDRAILTGADLLVTHHPLLFSAVKTITNEEFIGNRIIKLLQNDISYYAMHTNYDVLGMAGLSGTMLELQDAEAFEVTDCENQQGIGRIGTLERKMTLAECCEYVKTVFQLPNVKVFGDLNQEIQRVAISPGSGKKMTSLAISQNADVIITGDIDHHEGIDAVAQGLAVIDAGHYGLEYIFIDDVADFFRKNLDAVLVEQAEICQPFQVI